jgi:hypothetical protein
MYARTHYLLANQQLFHALALASLSQILFARTVAHCGITLA